MSGIVWHIFAFGTIGIFLIVITYRTLAIIRLPVHLRWELAPIPPEKGGDVKYLLFLHTIDHKLSGKPDTYPRRQATLLKTLLVGKGYHSLFAVTRV